MKVTALSDVALVSALKQLVATEHGATADVVEHLAEADARRLHITSACASLTAYCEERLGYSHDEAAHRVTAARLTQKYPMILPMLRAGQLNLSTLRTLSPVLTASNHRARLEAAVGRTRNELQRIVAGWAPKPDMPTRLTPLPSNEPPPLLTMMTAPADTVSKTVTPQPTDAEAPPIPPPQASPPRPAPLPKPLTPERFALQVTIDAATYESLMKLRDQMRHTFPDGDIAKIIARAVKDLRIAVEARKFGKRKTDKPKTPQTERPCAEQPTTAKPSTAIPSTAKPKAETPFSDARDPGSDLRDPTAYHPRAPGRSIRRAVAERDGKQCTYVSDDGHRCSSTAWLEADHEVDWAMNGPTSIENMHLLCHAHHRLKHDGPQLGG